MIETFTAGVRGRREFFFLANVLSTDVVNIFRAEFIADVAHTWEHKR